MKKFLVGLSAVILVLLALQTGVSADKKEKNDYLVMFDGPAKKGILQAFGVNDGDVLREFELLDVYQIELTDKQAKGLKNHPQIKFVEENAKAKAYGQTVPYGIPQVEGTTAQDNGFSGDGVKVAVLDTGIDRSHSDLNVAGGFSAYDSGANADPYNDGSGHGTHVAGTIAAQDNNLGVLGVTPNVELYAVKVLDNQGSGTYADIAEGIEWAIQNNMDVINMSLGGSSSSSILKEYSDLAYDSGILVVAAAGNEGSFLWFDTVGYPAAYDSVVAVAAVDENNQRGSFSSVGSQVELSAPGVQILSTVPGNGYDSYNGTSMASPHVAGVAAQVWQAKPGLSNVQLRQLLRDTAEPLGAQREYGYGLVQSMDAINQ
ncbi:MULTISPECIES: S8 family peptidase [Allobacillus]|uniref:S8 family peptidase n=1 Tax=Allobacillus salarius TaxID=1955272 RepID=A0A556PDU7_9BACI|nr:S8 family peptidase [Allobacillus salarius]TSJ62565.1 S8 family peptidase [Allobacillus salarius]